MRRDGKGLAVNLASKMAPAARESPASWLNPCAVTVTAGCRHCWAIGHTGWKQLQLQNYFFQPCHLPISYFLLPFFCSLPSNDRNIPSGFPCRTETGTRAGGCATFSCGSPGTALARSRSPQQPCGLGRAAGWGREGRHRDAGCRRTTGRSPGWMETTCSCGRSLREPARSSRGNGKLESPAPTSGDQSHREPALPASRKRVYPSIPSYLGQT